MPTSSGRLCCQLKRSGKYVDEDDCALTEPVERVGDLRGVCATSVMETTDTAAARTSSCFFMRCSILQAVRRAVLIAIVLGAVMVHLAAEKPADRVPLGVVLERAAWYLDYFIDQFENVVRSE